MNIQEAKDKFVDVLRDDLRIKYWRNGERNQNMENWYIGSSNLRTLYNLFDEIDTIEKLEETFYAKIKGWDKVKTIGNTPNSNVYWNCYKPEGFLILADKVNDNHFQTIATMKQWNELGIDHSNAVFEKA